MKWTVFNLFGGLFWIAGLCYAAGSTSALASLLPESNHRLLVGLAFGLTGLLVMLWSNLRDPAA